VIIIEGYKCGVVIMKAVGRLLLVIVIIAAVGFVLAQSSSPTIASDSTPEVAAEVGGEVGTASRASVDTRCVAGGDGWSNLCLSSDGSGSLTVTTDGVAREYRYAFYTDAGNCPAAPGGYDVQLLDWATTDWLDWGFTTEDLSALGLDALYCAYVGG
jgi:hypothetical protein